MSTSAETRMADYIDENSFAIHRMRLLAEGANYLYNEEAYSLYMLGITHNQHDAAEAFSALQVALTSLCEELRAMQQACIEEIKCQDAEC